jgi:hypothetical protein
MLLRDIWGLLNLGQFDPINQMIQLTVTPLSRAHCIFKLPRTVSNATVQNLLQGSRLLIIISSTVQNYFLQNSENYISETYPTLALTLCVVIGGYSLIEPPIFERLFNMDTLRQPYIIFFVSIKNPLNMKGFRVAV